MCCLLPLSRSLKNPPSDWPATSDRWSLTSDPNVIQCGHADKQIQSVVKPKVKLMDQRKRRRMDLWVNHRKGKPIVGVDNLTLDKKEKVTSSWCHHCTLAWAWRRQKRLDWSWTKTPRRCTMTSNRSATELSHSRLSPNLLLDKICYRSPCSLQVRDMIVTRPDIGFLRTDDDFILRFLRARKFDQVETFRLLAQYFQFRQQNLDMFQSFKVRNMTRFKGTIQKKKKCRKRKNESNSWIKRWPLFLVS